MVGGCGSNTTGIATEQSETSIPSIVAESTKSEAQWCIDFLAFDEQPTAESVSSILEAAPPRIESELEALRPLFLAVANFNEDNPDSDTQLVELRDNPDVGAASDVVNSYVDLNC